MILLTLLFSLTQAHAELDLKPRFERRPEASTDPTTKTLTLNFDIYTRETIVEIDGKKYRRIEYKSELFYLRLLAQEATGNDLEAWCGQEGSANLFNNKQAEKIHLATRLTKRTSLFISGLKQICLVDGLGQKRITWSPELRMGFQLDDGNERLLLRNKKLLITPALTPYFYAEW